MSITKASFWTYPKPLILASQSQTRRQMLERLNLAPYCVAADIDERRVETTVAPDEISRALARHKAVHIAAQFPDHIVLGADQTLSCEGVFYHKPKTTAEARTQLLALSGKTHELVSSAAVVCNGDILLECTQIAQLTMRALEMDFMDAYLEAMGETIFSTVGGYQIEALGAHLFTQIDGDHFTILGCPLLPVLSFFRQVGYVQ